MALCPPPPYAGGSTMMDINFTLSYGSKVDAIFFIEVPDMLAPWIKWIAMCIPSGICSLSNSPGVSCQEFS